MLVYRIESVDDPLFEKMWSIYDYSFPYFEKRTLSHQVTAFSNPDYHLDCYIDNDKFIGFIGYWDFSDYIYIEHYALDKEVRGSGYGTKILKEFIENAGKIIILEIDPVVDEVSTRRLRFYKHLNFVENPHSHKCHVYRHDCGEENLDILTYPHEVDCAFYKRFNEDLRDVVMKK